MRVKTFGSSGARSASAVTTQSATGCRPFFQDQHDVEGSAGRRAGEDHLHRPHAQIAAAMLRRAVDDHGVTAAGLPDETHAFHPLDPGFHDLPFILACKCCLMFSTRLHLPDFRNRRCRIQTHLSMLHRNSNVALCAAICEHELVCGSALLLLRHRRRIPPFSSYGGILKARSKPPRLFLSVAVRIGDGQARRACPTMPPDPGRRWAPRRCQWLALTLEPLNSKLVDFAELNPSANTSEILR